MEIKKDFMPTYQAERAFEVQLQEDLKTLAKRTEGLDGVDRAAIISARDVIVDERVRWKCRYPICGGYGSSALCPPHTPPVDECERVIHSFRYGVLYQMDVPIEDFTFTEEEWPEGSEQEGSYPIGKTAKHWLLNNSVCNQAEAWANSMGYRQAVSFQGGPCIGIWKGTCVSGQSGCAVLQGHTCRHMLKTRPAMEAMAIDVIGTVLPLGWDLVYIGGNTNKAEDIPCASTVGLLLVA